MSGLPHLLDLRSLSRDEVVKILDTVKRQLRRQTAEIEFIIGVEVECAGRGVYGDTVPYKFPQGGHLDVVHGEIAGRPERMQGYLPGPVDRFAIRSCRHKRIRPLPVGKG